MWSVANLVRISISDCVTLLVLIKKINSPFLLSIFLLALVMRFWLYIKDSRLDDDLSLYSHKCFRNKVLMLYEEIK